MNWLKLARQYIAMTRNNLCIISIFLVWGANNPSCMFFRRPCEMGPVPFMKGQKLLCAFFYTLANSTFTDLIMNSIQNENFRSTRIQMGLTQGWE